MLNRDDITDCEFQLMVYTRGSLDNRNLKLHPAIIFWNLQEGDPGLYFIVSDSSY